MSTNKKKNNLSKMKNVGEDNQRHLRAMQSLRQASRAKRAYKKGQSPSENRARLLREWRDGWFSTKD